MRVYCDYSSWLNIINLSNNESTFTHAIYQLACYKLFTLLTVRSLYRLLSFLLCMESNIQCLNRNISDCLDIVIELKNNNMESQLEVHRSLSMCSFWLEYDLTKLLPQQRGTARIHCIEPS